MAQCFMYEERSLTLNVGVFSSVGIGADDSPTCTLRLVFPDVIVEKVVLMKATLFVASACEKATWDDDETFDEDMSYLKRALHTFDPENQFRNVINQKTLHGKP